MINGEALGASKLGMLAVELFLSDNYSFRRNVLNGKLEFAVRSADGQLGDYRVLTQEALNSIVLRAKREEISEGNPKTEIQEYVNSEEVAVFNPIGDYLSSLPAWDGQNHVARLFSRLPGVSSEQLAYLSIWLRSTVAHWLQMDTLHGNEVVPTLIGPQGCGKTTFLRRLLPQHLREYYLDHLNLSNKFDKEMALTNNLLVNLDELDAIRPSQHAALKQTLSKSKVNGRPIYGCSQQDRPRFASFVATTNNPHPLRFIDNSGNIDYDQLYAQVLHELRELEAPYWFNNNEVARIQQLNQGFMEQKDMAEMITACFRKPMEGEAVNALNSKQVLEIIRHDFPNVKVDHSARIHVGQAMKELGFEHIKPGNISCYKAVPLVAA